MKCKTFVIRSVEFQPLYEQVIDNLRAGTEVQMSEFYRTKLPSGKNLRVLAKN